MTGLPEAPKRVLVTGFPIYVARRLVRELVAGGDQVIVLHREKFTADAVAFVADVNEQDGLQGGTASRESEKERETEGGRERD